MPAGLLFVGCRDRPDRLRDQYRRRDSDVSPEAGPWASISGRSTGWSNLGPAMDDPDNRHPAEACPPRHKARRLSGPLGRTIRAGASLCRRSHTVVSLFATRFAEPLCLGGRSPTMQMGMRHCRMAGRVVPEKTKRVLHAAPDAGRHRLNRGPGKRRWDDALPRHSDTKCEQPWQTMACDREDWGRPEARFVSRLRRTT